MQVYKSSSLGGNKNLRLEYVIENNIPVLRVEQTKDSLSRIRFKNDVYRDYLYLVSLSEADIEAKPVSRYVYSRLNTKQKLLDDVRIQLGLEEHQEQRMMRDTFLIGLISIYFLVSKGIIYNVPINPLNFILENEKRVRAFYREDSELGEITDEWLLEFKKLIAFYLIYDSSIIPEKFDEYTIQDYVSKMSTGTHQGFKKIYNCSSIDEMLPIFLKEDDINALTFSLPLSNEFETPIDISSGMPLDLDTSIVNATTIPVMDKEEIKQQMLEKNLLDKSKVRKAEKKERELERLELKRQREEEKAKRKIEKGYEPNEAKRKANKYNKSFKHRRPSLTPLLVLMVIIMFGMGFYYFKVVGNPFKQEPIKIQEDVPELTLKMESTNSNKQSG